jgi:hypothetical protein
MIDNGDFGWGDAEADASSQAFDHVGSAVLVVASGVYCGALWLASGLQPLPYLASRVRSHLRDSLDGARSLQ